MKLVDCNPKWLKTQTGQRCYLNFKCPCSLDCPHEICIPITPDIDGVPAPDLPAPWRRVSGDSFENLTLEPSIWLHADTWGDNPHQGWHGFLRNGELQTA